MQEHYLSAMAAGRRFAGAGAVLLAAGVLALTRSHLTGIDDEEELDEVSEATAITVGSDT